MLAQAGARPVTDAGVGDQVGIGGGKEEEVEEEVEEEKGCGSALGRLAGA